MEPHYIEQSRLVVEVLPLVSQEPQFALCTRSSHQTCWTRRRRSHRSLPA